MKNIKRIIVMLLSMCIIFNTVVFVQAEAENGESERAEAIKIILSELSIMQGDPDGNMRYSDLVARSEFAKIAVMASAYRDYVVPEMKLTVFGDVKGDNWCSPYVWVGVKNSMFSGYPDGTFKPSEIVLYEEAANVFLRILGYTDDDIGPSWPYGPVALANNIGLDENIDAYAGKVLTRYDVANMVYNMLNTVSKGTNSDYISKLGYSIIDDVMIIASYAEDTSVGVNNVYTSAGTFEMKKSFDKDAIGMSGDLVVKDSTDAVCLIPSGQRKVTYTVTDLMGGGLMLDDKLFNIDENTVVYYGKNQYTYKNLYSLSINRGDEFSLVYGSEGYIEHAILVDKSKDTTVSELKVDKYVVYSAVNDDIIFYKNSEMTKYDIPDTTDVYKEDVRLTYADIKNQLEMGDILYLTLDAYGNVKYIKYEEGSFKGPVRANGMWQDELGVDLSSASVVRNGVKSTKENISSNDILYYNKDLNLVLAYYKTVTGFYENALPNKDVPTSVTISGVSYGIDGVEAFNKLSSGGNIPIGKSITVLIGRDGKIADVMSDSMADENAYGFLIDAGSSGGNYYAKIVASDGRTTEYPTVAEYKEYVNMPVRVNITGSDITLEPYTDYNDVFGSFNWSTKTLGKGKLSKDVEILNIDKDNNYSGIAPQMIDGKFVTSGSVLYSKVNTEGEITDLILKNVYNAKLNKYVVYSVVNNDVIFYHDSQMMTYNIPDSTTLYKDDTPMTYSSIKNQLEMGDILYLSFKDNGKIDYAEYEEGVIEGPVLASKGSWQSMIGADGENVSVVRNGIKATKDEISENDIIYYCEELKLILAYYKTVTGVYEKASPNRDTPTSVTISGKTYSIEGIEAFNKLSSGGSISLGDTITVVFGKDGKIADVILNDTASSEIFGYLIETGTGSYENNDGEEYSTQYIKVVAPDGEVGEYTTSKDYSSYKNSIVRVKINNGKASVTPWSASEKIYGTVNWSRRTIGDFMLADEVSILDIRTVDKNKTAAYTTVFPQRLDKVTITSDDVYFVNKNENGKITELILADVTADSWSYGILSDVISSKGKTMGYEVYSKNATIQTDITGIGGMAAGKGVRMSVGDKGIENIWMLNEVANPSEITSTKVIGTSAHTISDSVEVYVRSGDMSSGYTYNYAELSQVVGIDRKKIVAAYYDEAESKGGRVRVIVVSE